MLNKAWALRSPFCFFYLYILISERRIEYTISNFITKGGTNAKN